ncbi:hypothetical protein [Vagococcus fluvialis]|uniref:hypothetical protein n=1 Tax=Vagococcus fluvialis TaxID=2738 RepID=UPI0037AE3981
MSEKKYYEVRAFPNNEDQYDTFIENKFVAIGWPSIGNVFGKSKEEIRKLIEKDPKINILNEITLSQVASYFDRLLKMEIGDIILIPYKNNSVTITTVTKIYSYVDSFSDTHMAHQIGINVEKIVSLDRLSEGLRNSLKARLTLTMIKDRYYDEVDALILGKNLSDIEEFNKNINAILDEYTYETHPLIKSSLLLSAFSICEGYLSNKIRQTLKLQEFDKNKEELSLEEFVRYKGMVAINRSLGQFDGRNNIFKDIYKDDKPKFPNSNQKDLRNSLAHNISGPFIQLKENAIAKNIDNEIISFDNSNKKQVDIEVLDLLNSFKSYATDLEKQINQS